MNPTIQFKTASLSVAKSCIAFSLAGYLLLIYAGQAAASIVSVTDPTGDLFQANGHPTQPRFYAPVVDLTEASVSLEDGTNTFEITAVGDVLVPAAFAGSARPIRTVFYGWHLFDIQGRFIGGVFVVWQNGTISALVLKAGPCVGIFSLGNPCDAMTLASPGVAGSGHSLSVDVSATDLASFLGTEAATWRAGASALSDVDPPGVGVDSVMDLVGEGRAAMPE